MTVDLGHHTFVNLTFILTSSWQQLLRICQISQQIRLGTSSSMYHSWNLIHSSYVFLLLLLLLLMMMMMMMCCCCCCFGYCCCRRNTSSSLPGHTSENGSACAWCGIRLLQTRFFTVLFLFKNYRLCSLQVRSCRLGSASTSGIPR